MEENKKSGGWDVRASKSPSEMAYHGQLHASEGEAEAQLGDSETESHEPRRVGCGVNPSGRDIHPLIHTMPYCLR